MSDPETMHRKLEGAKARRQANLEQAREWERRYRREKLDRQSEAKRLREWRRANPEKAKAQYYRRYAREREGGPSFTAQEWADLCARYDNRCLKCGVQKDLTPDHVKPLSKNGSNNISNIQPLCRSCNCSKRDKEIDYRPRFD